MLIGTACSAFGLAVLETKTEKICLQKIYGKVSFAVAAAAQVYKQTIKCVYLGGATSAGRYFGVEINRSLQRAWTCFQQYNTICKLTTTRACICGSRCGC